MKGNSVQDSIQSSVQVGVQNSVQDSVQDSVQSSVQNSSALNKHKLNKTKHNKPPISPLDVFAQVEDDRLKAALRDFEAMRREIKKPLTDRAKELLLQRLNDLSSDPVEQVDILNQSIMNNWQGIFALKNKPRCANYDDDGDFLGR